MTIEIPQTSAIEIDLVQARARIRELELRLQESLLKNSDYQTARNLMVPILDAVIDGRYGGSLHQLIALRDLLKKVPA